MGSLFAALTTAVAGLNAQSNAIGNISDNLANAETVGFKGVGTNFEDLVNGSSSTVFNPGGAISTPAYQNDVQGSITTSQVSTNLAISGEGFFAVEGASQSTTGATTFTNQILYTRQGDFALDKNGYLVNSSGFYLTAYQVSQQGVVDTSATSPVQVSALLNDPVPTSTVTYEANLPSNQTVGFDSTPSTVQMFDTLGNTHDLTYTWSETATNTWQLDVSAPDASYDQKLNFTFNDGTSGPAGTIESIATGSGSGATVVTPDGSGDAADVSINLTFPGTSAQTVNLNFGTYDVATASVTQFSNPNGQVAVTNFDQDGLAQGSFNSFTISSAGLVSINYSNGTTRTIAQIPLVQFFAPDQLQAESGGVFAATLGAGTPRYNVPGESGAGTISSSSLEQSNVDIATQFTDLIQAQQVYSANAKVVTTDNQLLQVTINMVQ